MHVGDALTVFAGYYVPCFTPKMLLLSCLAMTISSANGQTGKHLPLPSGAVVAVGEKFVGHDVSDAAMCKAYTLSAREVRMYFRHYRVVRAEEKHYRYQQANCYIKGTVTVKGRQFTWVANPGGTIGTTFPDGVQKELGTTDPAMLDTP